MAIVVDYVLRDRQSEIEVFAWILALFQGLMEYIDKSKK